MAGTLRTYIESILPPFLARNGKTFLQAFNDQADLLNQNAAFAANEGMIETATSDAYPAHLYNSGLPSVAGEGAAATLATLRNRWTLARETGSSQGVTDSLARLGFNGAQVWSGTDLVIAGAVGGAPFGGNNRFFFVLLPWPNPLAVGATDQWADGSQYGSAPPAPVWAFKAGSGPLIAQIKATIQARRHPCSSCRFVVVAQSSSFAFSPTSSPAFTGTFTIFPLWEAWEAGVTGNGLPNQAYNYSYLVR